MRKLFVVLVAATLMFTLPGAAGAETKKFEVALRTASSDAVIISRCDGAPTGATAKLTGTVSPTRAGKTIKIYQRIAGKSTWNLAGTARIRSSGRYAFYDAPATPKTHEYQARMPTVGSYRGAYSPKVTVEVRDGSCRGAFDVTARTNRKTYTFWCGGRVEIKITGTVSPVRAGKYVSIYKRLDGGSGQLEGKARVRSSGRFAFIDRPTTTNPRSYKAKMSVTGSYAAGFSSYTPQVRLWRECED